MASHDPRFSLVVTKDGAYLQSVYPNALTQRRIKQYESELRRIGAVGMSSDPDEIYIGLVSSGLRIGASDWSYIRSRQPPAPVITLEQALAGEGGDGWSISLGSGWYVQVSHL